MADKLNILFLTSEVSPLVMTGGLADVAGALPKALVERGHDVRIAMPCYSRLPEENRGEARFLCEADLGATRAYGQFRESRTPGTKLPLYLVEHDGYFGRDGLYDDGEKEFPDNAERFCFFVLAALHGVEQTGWKPDVIHCNDWHTAAAPAFLKTRYANHPIWGSCASVLTIHNLAFQGRYDAAYFMRTGLDPSLFTPTAAEFHGDMNLMKAGIAFADKINTVSPRYAREIQTAEYGVGLEDMLHARRADLHGILNGVDYKVWRPDTDPFIAAPFSVDDMTGKQACKRAMQQAYGLPEKDVPLFSVVSRLTWQKGINLILEALPALCRHDIQVTILGNGDHAMEESIRQHAAAFPEQVGIQLAFDPKLSHQVYAGSDFFLMPSRYEPCGLSQLYSLAYGTIPIVRRTGGLADSVHNHNAPNLKHKAATGFAFTPMTAPALVRAVERAMVLYHDPQAIAETRERAMRADFSWSRSSADYEALYREALSAA